MTSKTRIAWNRLQMGNPTEAKTTRNTVSWGLNMILWNEFNRVIMESVSSVKVNETILNISRFGILIDKPKYFL